MNNGGAAFPSPGVVLSGTSGEMTRQQGAYEGMSLRDYFAIQWRFVRFGNLKRNRVGGSDFKQAAQMQEAVAKGEAT